MKSLKTFFDLYITSSVHVALAVVALSLISFLENGLTPDWNLLLFIFFGSVTGYNFVKYAGVSKLQHPRLAHNLRIIQIFSLLCFTGLVFTAFHQEIIILGYSALFAILTFLYAVPVFKGENLRNLTGIKIFIIAVVWAGVSVILPLIEIPGIQRIDIVILFFQRIFFVVLITLPFEIRDLQFDAPGLKTIPQQFGIKNTRIFGLGLIGIILVLELLKSHLDLKNLIPLLFALITGGLFLLRSGGEQKKYFASFWVEGIPLMWLGFWLIFRIFV